MTITLDNALKLEYIKSHGLDKNIGYKVIVNTETIFFLRWINQAWHETKENIPFSDLNAIEYLESILTSGQKCELIFFGCCCHDCRGSDIIASHKKILDLTGFKVSHGLFPEHVEKEIAYCEREMEKSLPESYKTPKAEIPKQNL